MSEVQRAMIFTIVSRNYAAQARVLMESLARYEPDVDRVVVVSDGVLTSKDVGGARALRVEDLASSAPIRAMSTYYDALEFNTAIKPFCFHALLGQAERVIYLDPDIRLYDSLLPVWTGFDKANLLLTPHLLQPLREDGHPNSTDILKSGVYNLGFLGLQRSAETLAFAAWWGERCRFDCRVDFEAGLFTDQRWVDLAPGFVHPICILRDPGLNVAYWNLAERPLSRENGRWTVEGAPLRFFHFSGFDPARPDLLSKHQDRVCVTPGSPISQLLDGYAKAMKAAGSARTLRRAYGFSTFAGGRPVTGQMRRTFLEAARAGRMLDDGLSIEQADWIHSLAPESLASDRLRTWGGDEWIDTGALIHRTSPPIVDPPWLGRAKDAGGWLMEETPDRLPRALAAFQRARNDIASVTPRIKGGDERLLLALCIGPEAAAGRFSVDLLPRGVLARLAQDETLLEAARLWRPFARMTETVSELVARYALATAADWPRSLTEGRLAKLDSPAEVVWRGRPDLQAAFDLRKLSDRLRLYRWFTKVGALEYALDAATLPPVYHAVGLKARGSITLAKSRSRPKALNALICVPRRLASDLEDRLWLKTIGTPLNAAGALPRRIETCIHYGELAEAVLGWMIMHRRRVEVTRHVWAPATDSATPAFDDPAWSFVDAVWAKEHSAPYPHPRVNDTLSEHAPAALLMV